VCEGEGVQPIKKERVDGVWENTTKKINYLTQIYLLQGLVSDLVSTKRESDVHERTLK